MDERAPREDPTIEPIVRGRVFDNRRAGELGVRFGGRETGSDWKKAPSQYGDGHYLRPTTPEVEVGVRWRGGWSPLRKVIASVALAATFVGAASEYVQAGPMDKVDELTDPVSLHIPDLTWKRTVKNRAVERRVAKEPYSQPYLRQMRTNSGKTHTVTDEVPSGKFDFTWFGYSKEFDGTVDLGGINAQQLEEIEDIVSELQADPQVNITGIEVVGFASDDNNEQGVQDCGIGEPSRNNLRLAEARAVEVAGLLESTLQDNPENPIVLGDSQEVVLSLRDQQLIAEVASQASMNLGELCQAYNFAPDTLDNNTVATLEELLGKNRKAVVTIFSTETNERVVSVTEEAYGDMECILEKGTLTREAEVEVINEEERTTKINMPKIPLFVLLAAMPVPFVRRRDGIQTGFVVNDENRLFTAAGRQEAREEAIKRQKDSNRELRKQLFSKSQTREEGERKKSRWPWLVLVPIAGGLVLFSIDCSGVGETTDNTPISSGGNTEQKIEGVTCEVYDVGEAQLVIGNDKTKIIRETFEPTGVTEIVPEEDLTAVDEKTGAQSTTVVTLQNPETGEKLEFEVRPGGAVSLMGEQD